MNGAPLLSGLRWFEKGKDSEEDVVALRKNAKAWLDVIAILRALENDNGGDVVIELTLPIASLKYAIPTPPRLTSQERLS